MQTLEIPSSLNLSTTAANVVAELDRRVEQIRHNVLSSPLWKNATHPKATADHLRSLVRENMLSVYWYQRHTTEAGFHMLGRFPKDSGRLLTVLLAHKADEAEHGLWALRDYLKLGGIQPIADSPPSPAAFNVAATWWWMAYHEEPLGYLGAEYLFEYLTALLAPDIVDLFSKNGITQDGLGFLVDHAQEDEKHTQLLRAMVGRAVDSSPECVSAIYRCFDYFSHVYPLPVWNEAAARAGGSTVGA